MINHPCLKNLLLAQSPCLSFQLLSTVKQKIYLCDMIKKFKGHYISFLKYNVMLNCIPYCHDVNLCQGSHRTGCNSWFKHSQCIQMCLIHKHDNTNSHPSHSHTNNTSLAGTTWIEISTRRFWTKFNGLAQDCSNSIANALELLQSCTKPSRYGMCFVCSKSDLCSVPVNAVIYVICIMIYWTALWNLILL